MKKLLSVLSAVFIAASAIWMVSADDVAAEDTPLIPTITDVYQLKMSINTPRVYNNSDSKGYRKYHRDNLIGELRITYPADCSGKGQMSIVRLSNISHIVGGKNVTYETVVDEESLETRINLIGNNKTGVFKDPSVAFALICNPSYNIGGVEEDNTLYICLAGTGGVAKNKRKGSQVISRLKGNLAGTLGCGCSAYGHKSPTRVNGACGPLNRVDDVAAVWGSWQAIYRYSEESVK